VNGGAGVQNMFTNHKPGMENNKDPGGYQPPDYNQYTMPVKLKVFYTVFAAAVIYIIIFIFYRSHILSLLLTPLAVFYPRIRTGELIQKRKHNLELQFKDMLYSLSSSLSAGKSVEQAFRDVLKDLEIIYGEQDADILKEVGYIIRKIEINQTIEEALSDFAGRAHLEDIDNFVDVFLISKRAGGNIVEIIKNTSNIISDKIEIRQEIDTLLAQRKFERKVLNAMPVLMIFFLSVSANDYINPVYNTLHGRVAMTAAIILLVVAFFISKKVMDIKV